MLLLTLLALVGHCAAFWSCPTSPLGNGINGKFPLTNDTQYRSGTVCNFTITVPNQQTMLSLSISNGLKYGDSCRVYDDYGTVYTEFGAVPEYVNTVLNLHIDLNTTHIGDFSFKWTYTNVRTSKAFNYVDVTAGQQAAIFSIKDLYRSNTTIIQGKEALIIYGDFSSSGTRIVVSLTQEVLVYAGEGINGTFLGSLYSLATSRKPIIYSQIPYTITIVSLYPTDGSFLIRPASEVKNIDYRIWSYEFTKPTQYVSLTSTNKPAVITIIENGNYYYNYMYSINFSSSITTMDWLPGSFLPPHTPITTLYPAYANNIAKVPLNIPGQARTFVVYNGTVNFSFGWTYPAGYNMLDNGDWSYLATQAYTIPQAIQYNSIGIGMRNRTYLGIRFTVLGCFDEGQFNITIENGSDRKKYALNSGSLYTAGDGFGINYHNTYNPRDTGGLIKFEIVDVPSSSGALIFLVVLILQIVINFIEK